ncbi:MAG: DctP family TRAP transporter solute-binding subunit [Desulfohalobiaceae bacterium]|nr:DctP family TRAP transporter solute-binding subunit [Desulfohalobiaceae bacterium]
MNKSFFTTLIFVIFSLVLLCPSVYANPDNLKLGFVTAATENDPYNITSKKFAELIEEYSQGKFKVDIFPSGQLGNERDMIKNLTMGTMDLGVITNAPVGSFINAFMVLDLPFMFADREVAHKVLDGEAGKMLLSKLEKMNIKGLAFSEGGYRHMINNVRPIMTPEDTEDIKFRVMKTPIYIGLFKSLGSNAVPLPWGEVFTAVQQKVVDGLEIPIPVIYSNKFYEVTKYLSLTGHTYSPLIIMCSKKRWNSFTEEEQGLIARAAQEAADYERDALKGIISNFLEKLEGKGMEINEVPDKKPFQDAVKPMYKDFEDKIGKDVLETVLEARSNVR